VAWHSCVVAPTETFPVRITPINQQVNHMLFPGPMPHAQAGEATAEYSSASGELIVEYRLSRHLEEPARIPDIFAFGPGGFQRPLKVEKVAEGFFRERVRIEDRQGLFRVRPLEESRAFPEVVISHQKT